MDDGPQRDRFEQPGLWVRHHDTGCDFSNRAGLFLDRDGVINVDTGYPRAPSDIVLVDRIVPLIRAANRRGIPVMVVSNQSGVGRGYMGWDAVIAVSDHIDALLAERGARLDCVLACAYYGAGQPPYDIDDHPMRKPNPGMLLRGAALCGADLSASVIVGDKASDMEADRRAGLKAGWLVGDRAAVGERDETFTVRPLPDDPLNIL